MKKDELKEYLLRDAASLRALSFSENYIRDAIATTEKWGGTGLLAGIPDPYIGRQMARLLENQRLFNEQSADPIIPEGADTNYNAAQWRRISIPCVRRVFGSFLPHQLVSVQVISKPEDNIYFTGLDERQYSRIVHPTTRSIGREWWRFGAEEYLGENGAHSIDKEAEAVAAFCQRYSNDVDREVVRDLTNNAGSNAHAEYADPDQLVSLIEGMSAYIAAKIKGRDATWIVTTPKVADLLRPYIGEWHEDTPHTFEEGSEGAEWASQAVQYRGLLKDKWKLYELPVQKEGTILMGHKDHRNHYFSGYFYAPFQPFNMQAGWWKEDGTHSHASLYSRYAKKLIDANFYGVINVSNLPADTVPEEPTNEENATAEGEA